MELLESPLSPLTCAASDACLSLGSLGSPSSPRSRDGQTSDPAAAADPRPAPAAAGPAESTGNVSPQSTSQPAKQPILDLDPHRLAQRQKQIDFGKNTVGYQRYLQLVPRNKRRRTDPATPDIHANISKRRFDGQVVVWRRALHKYDDDAAQDGAPSAASASASSAVTVPRQQQQQQYSLSSNGSCASSSYPSTSYSYGTAGHGLSVVVPPAHPPPPMLAECTSLASYSDAACGDGSTVLSVTASAGPSSPTSSCGGSRRSLDGYLEPQQHHSHHSHSLRRRRTLMSEEGEEEDVESVGFRCEVLPRERPGGKAKAAAAVGGECQRQASSSSGASDAACGGLWAQGKQVSQGQGRRGPQQPGLSREQLRRLAEQHKHLAAAAAALVPVVVVAGDDDGGADPIVAYHPVYETEAGHRMVMTRGGAATTASAPAAGGSAEGQQLLALPVEVVYGSGAEVLGFRDHRQAGAAAPATASVVTFGVAVRASQAAAAQLDVGMGAGCSAVVVVEKPAARQPELAAPAADKAHQSRPCGAAASVAEGEERALVDSLTSLLLH
ncbi:hypothetical protein HYH02_007323 [Chlamydomonas schloesseri]|uniref:Histone RNA hairpin-binding protein RNA-binding domain-containing protein n=1 Tax=Chlamydomonas schloesseri TaxID=2026947 RepID=A0A835WHY4_9CHLO|nr:hypothetical protein HYH02_007323 [Chlamydomonas schloesseri]|eukprot:KAG2447867.1 hypothetical protein HYH02_007323 [Chlamydomonas schloesseri]